MTDNHEPEADVHLEPQGEPATSAPATVGPLVFVMETALRELRAHAAEEPEHEIGGILVGSVTDGERPVVLVEAAIRGHSMAHARGSVTFTHETWNEINAVKDSQYPDLKIVGWYHSHPGFGLFLSGHDLFIHRNFFTAPWQVAIVADPLARSWGCFTWQGGDLAQEDAVHTVAVQWSPDEPRAETDPPAPSPTTIVTPPAPPARDRGVVWALGVLGLLLALQIGISLSSYRDTQKLRSEFATLSQQMNNLSHELTAVRDRVMDMPEAPTPGSHATSGPAEQPAPPAPLPPAQPPPGATP